MSLTPGARLGPYEIVALLGAGGMGEVYRARDTKLGRFVAVKVLPEAFAADADRVSRFQREAQLLASLNHPHIAALYGMEEMGPAVASAGVGSGRGGPAVSVLVMELVEGDTLADRITRGTLSLLDTLKIAHQIAEALEAAHDQGVIHRDLKPANVKVTPDDNVKVLDFGLAKAMDTSPVAMELSHSPTLSRMATQAGMILGTAAYMSPEQAKGCSADQRSDIFSFGTVLYEMLTGRQPFQGDTAPDVLASVIVREPDLTQLAPNLNPRLSELLRRCLEKNPKKRWQAIGDVRAEIEIIAAAPHSAGSGGGAAQAALAPRPPGRGDCGGRRGARRCHRLLRQAVAHAAQRYSLLLRARRRPTVHQPGPAGGRHVPRRHADGLRGQPASVSAIHVRTRRAADRGNRRQLRRAQSGVFAGWPLDCVLLGWRWRQHAQENRRDRRSRRHAVSGGQRPIRHELDA
jgi:hypothetical protein